VNGTTKGRDTLNQYVDWHIPAEPTHYNQTLSQNCEEHAEWRAAMDEEIASMKRFEVFDEVTRDSITKDRQVLDCKWVYKRKRDKDGFISRYRARVVIFFIFKDVAVIFLYHLFQLRLGVPFELTFIIAPTFHRAVEHTHIHTQQCICTKCAEEGKYKKGYVKPLPKVVEEKKQHLEEQWGK
jgi:hypothetical protein